MDDDELIDNPIATITALYAGLDLSMSPGFGAELTAYAQSHPSGRHGRHHYTLGNAEIDIDQVKRRLAG